MNIATRLHRRKVVLAFLSALSTQTRGQTGVRLLSLIVPQPPGNPTDSHARKLQPLLQLLLGQTVVVENVAGAGGSLGVRKVLAANGPMLLIASQTESILTPMLLSAARYGAKDLLPIAITTRGPYVLVARRDLPTTLSEFIRVARLPGTLPVAFGHGGHGSMIHLLAEQFTRKAGLNAIQVPYKGTPPLVQDLISGQIDLAFLPLGGSTASLIESGRVRGYGVTASDATLRLPGLTPLSEQLASLGKFVYATWGCIFVARNTPENIVMQLHRALTSAVRSADFVAYVRTGGSELAAPMTLAQLELFHQSELETYRLLVQELGMKPE